MRIEKAKHMNSPVIQKFATSNCLKKTLDVLNFTKYLWIIKV